MTLARPYELLSMDKPQIPTASDDEAIISQQTMNWIRSFIIEYNICPFARHVVEHGTLKLQVSTVTDTTSALEDLMLSVQQLDSNTDIETSLLIFPNLFTDFMDYLDFVDLAETLLLEQDYEGIYQLATFHPDYCFAGVLGDDVSNFTNRSPYPMLHLLREDSIEQAIEFHGKTEEIPQENIATMHKLGLDKIKKILQAIR